MLPNAVITMTGSSGSISLAARSTPDRKSTRLNSSHTVISYAVFCLKKKKRAGITRARSDTELVVGDLAMDEEAREVRRGGEPIELTATAFELLRFLMRNPRRVLSKA